MNKKYLSLLIIFICIFISTIGCQKKNEDSACLSFKKAPVTSVVGSNVTTVNQEIILTVSFSCINGCGDFGNFEETITGNTTTIAVNAKYQGCICTQEIPTRQTTYRFKKSQTGTYDVRFLQTENTYFTYTITVQ